MKGALVVGSEVREVTGIGSACGPSRPLGELVLLGVKWEDTAGCGTEVWHHLTCFKGLFWLLNQDIKALEVHP